jgi:hypothetical protein
MPLLPYIKRLAVDLVDRSFRNGHRARIASEEEIHVIYISVGARQIHTGEMAAWTQVRQVLGVDTDQPKSEFPLIKGKFEISFT